MRGARLPAREPRTTYLTLPLTLTTEQSPSTSLSLTASMFPKSLHSQVVPTRISFSRFTAHLVWLFSSHVPLWFHADPLLGAALVGLATVWCTPRDCRCGGR